jgi:SAM-dependent methyltransferase
MNPLLKNTVGRLPLFRSITQKPAEPEPEAQAPAEASPTAPARPATPSPSTSQLVARFERPKPRPQPQAPAAPPPAVEKVTAQERAQLVAKIDALHQRISPEPNLVPPPELMRAEGVATLEEWFRRGEEWGTLLRAYGNLSAAKAVLEIGCGLGDVALALRDVLPQSSTYDGIDADRGKVEFLGSTLGNAYSNFRFAQADNADQHRLPYDNAAFDVIFAVSAFTHLLPPAAATVLAEMKRVLAPSGQIVLGMMLLDHYEPGRPRPATFQSERYNVDHRFGDPSREEFRVGDTHNPTDVTAYASTYLAQLAGEAGLRLAHHPIPGQWSASTPEWVGRLDLVVLEHVPVPEREVSYLDRL